MTLSPGRPQRPKSTSNLRHQAPPKDSEDGEQGAAEKTWLSRQRGRSMSTWLLHHAGTARRKGRAHLERGHAATSEQATRNRCCCVGSTRDICGTVPRGARPSGTNPGKSRIAVAPEPQSPPWRARIVAGPGKKNNPQHHRLPVGARSRPASREPSAALDTAGSRNRLLLWASPFGVLSQPARPTSPAAGAVSRRPTGALAPLQADRLGLGQLRRSTHVAGPNLAPRLTYGVFPTAGSARPRGWTTAR